MTPDPSLLNTILTDAIEVSKQAGKAILDVYHSDNFNIQTKTDNSPLTRADLAAHTIITEHLTRKYPDIPCLSEESRGIRYEDRKSWDQCFIIDPLDGTKEFIAKNGEFTVNIAYVIHGKPVLGVIYAPVPDTLYYAAKQTGAYKKNQDQAPRAISVRSLKTQKGRTHFTVVASRRHGLDKVETMCRNLPGFELTSRGSSLKMCLVAEGSADLYPRLAPTSEWDTAAAQAIVTEAGGRLVKLDFTEIIYNQKESLLNPFFLVLGDPDFNWEKELVIP